MAAPTFFNVPGTGYSGGGLNGVLLPMNMPGMHANATGVEYDPLAGFAQAQATPQWMPPPFPNYVSPAAPFAPAAPAMAFPPVRPAGTRGGYVGTPFPSGPRAVPNAVGGPVAMPSGTARPFAAGSAMPSPSANLNGNLGGIFGQIAGDPYQPVNAPHVGATRAQQNLIDYNQYLWNLANMENQHRFQQAAAALQGAGQASTTDALQNAANANAINDQNNISRGLNNSTIGATEAMGVNRELNRQLQHINEGTAQQLVNLLESKTEKAPDAMALAQLLMQAASNPGLGSMIAGGFHVGGVNGGIGHMTGLDPAPSFMSPWANLGFNVGGPPAF